MKDFKKVYAHFNILQRNRDNQLTKVTYSSLDKYNGSPYLQRVVPASYKKPNRRQITPLKATQEGQNNQFREVKQEQKQITLLPKLATPIKYKEGQVINYFKTQFESAERALQKNRQSAGTHSATLQVNATKKKKLQPLNKSHKIHFVCKTKAGTTGKQTKINQDMPIIETKFPFDIKLFAVCDGHGVNGHLVSAFLKTHFLNNLNSAFKKLTVTPTIEQFKALVKQIIAKTNQQLLQSDINTQLSGSTFIAVFIINNKLISFNVGDSRAIMASRQLIEKEQLEQKNLQGHQKENLKEIKEVSFKKETNYNWKVVQLSSDHKPERPDERQRVLNGGGRIFSQKNQKGEDLGPLRVWMKQLPMPGLAMTRSLGDKAGLKAGTSAQPEIFEFEISQQDKFLVVASDGIWEYLQNQEVINLIAPLCMKDEYELAAERLVKIATEIWQKVSFSRDDITAIIVSLNSAST